MDNYIRDGIIVKRSQGWKYDSYTIAYIGEEGELQYYESVSELIFLSFSAIKKYMESEYLAHCRSIAGADATDTFSLIIKEQERIYGYYDKDAPRYDCE